MMFFFMKTSKFVKWEIFRPLEYVQIKPAIFIITTSKNKKRGYGFYFTVIAVELSAILIIQNTFVKRSFLV